MAGREPFGQPFAEMRHGVGARDAERFEAETAGTRLDDLAQGVAREDGLLAFQKSRSA